MGNNETYNYLILCSYIPCFILIIQKYQIAAYIIIIERSFPSSLPPKINTIYPKAYPEFHARA